MKTIVVTANQKAWSDGLTGLVADGHPAAKVLVAMKGHRVPKERVESFINASEFFDGLPSADAPDQDQEKPRRGRSRINT